MKKIGVNNQKGITLIALVLTIIILLLLAGISISMITGQDGILAKALKAKQNTQIESEKEKIKLAVLESMFEGNNQINKDTLNTELSKYFNNAKINGDSFPIMIEIGDNIYKVNADGTVDEGIFELETLSSTDGKITLTNLSGNNVVNYKISGNSIQDGTPTPTAPIEIQSVGEKTNNIFSYETLLESDYIELIDKKSGEFNLKNVTNIPSTYIKAKENTQYNISYKVKIVEQQSIQITVFYTDESMQSITTNYGVIGEYVTVKGISAEGKTIDYIKFGGSTGIKAGTTFKELQISENETEYEPYGYKIPIKVNGNTTNIYIDEPLRKCGKGYDDCIEFATNTLTRKTLYFDNILDGIAETLPTKPYKTDTSSTLYATWGYFIIRGDLKSKPFSNHFIGLTSTISGLNTLNAIQHATEYNRAYLDMQIRILEDFGGLERGGYLNLTDDERLELINNFMITNEVDYQVGTSKHTNTTINLQEIQLQEGTNIIEVDTTVKPSNMEITYYKKTQ